MGRPLNKNHSHLNYWLAVPETQVFFYPNEKKPAEAGQAG
jgi:hypothetical protein